MVRPGRAGDRPGMTQTAPRPLFVAALLTGLIAAVFGFGIYLFPVLLPDMRAGLGFGYDTAGLATAIAQAGFFTASLAGAVAAPRFGAVPTMALALLASVLALTAMAAASHIFTVMALLFVLAGAAALGWTPVAEIVQATIPARHRGLVLGLVSSGTSYGVFLNGALVPPVLAIAGWRGAWLMMALLTALLLAAFVLQLRSVQPASPARPEERWEPAAVRHGPVVVLVAIMFATGLACAPLQTYLGGLLREDGGWDAQAATQVWSVLGVAGMIGGVAFGWLADRLSVRLALVLAATVLLLAVLGLTRPAEKLLVYPAIAGFGIAFMAMFGLVPAYLARTVVGAGATRMFGIVNMALAVGNMTGNLAGGLLRASTGSFLPLYGAIAVVVLAVLILAILLPDERRGTVAKSAHKTAACPDPPHTPLLRE